MSEAVFHPEEVRAILRMRYTTLEGFADAKGIKSQAVRDFLRGESRSAARIIAKELGVDPKHLTLSKGSTNVDLDSSGRGKAHRQNAGAK